MGLTKDYEILEWPADNSEKVKKEDSQINVEIIGSIKDKDCINNYDFLLQKPHYLVSKIKFSRIFINSTLAMGINFHGNLFVWGKNKDGLLGLGYNIIDVETPTEILANVKELSISENHAVAIDLEGEVYSWGCGKYGELCQNKRIYCSYPTKKNALDNSLEENDYININYNSTINNISRKANPHMKRYKKVFCSDLLTCFIDQEGKFSYFGVIIKIYRGSSSSITLKSLLKDENNSDPTVLFQEKFIFELESEKFTQITIGNGFIGLLSEKGLVYTVDHSDNITLLYTKYCIYSIGVSNNQLFGLCKNSCGRGLNNTEITGNFQYPKLLKSNNINNKNNTYSNIGYLNKTEDEIILNNFDNARLNLNYHNLSNVNGNDMNYFLCRWVTEFINNDVLSDSWSTELYKINTQEVDLENMFLLNSNNKEILFIMQYTGNLNTSNNNNDIVNDLDLNNNIYMNNNNVSIIETKAKSFLRETKLINENKIESFNSSGFLRKNSAPLYANPLILLSKFDNSYNIKYKRVKNNFQGLRILSLDKSKTLRLNKEKESCPKTEAEEISQKLNNSIRKHSSSINRQTTLHEPFHINLNNDVNIHITDDMPNTGVNNFNHINTNNYNKNSIHLLSEKSTQHIYASEINNNNLKNDVSDINNHLVNKTLNQNFGNTPNRNRVNKRLRKNPAIANDNKEKNIFFSEDYEKVDDFTDIKIISSNNLNYVDNNIVGISSLKKYSDNSVNQSSYNNEKENINSNPYRNKTNQNRNYENFYNTFNRNNTNNPNFLFSGTSLNNHKFSNHFEDDKSINAFRNHSSSNKKNSLNEDSLTNQKIEEKNKINNDNIRSLINKNSNEDKDMNNIMINKSHNFYKNQKLNLSRNLNENEENFMKIKINNTNSAEIFSNCLSYKRNKSI